MAIGVLLAAGLGAWLVSQVGRPGEQGSGSAVIQEFEGEGASVTAAHQIDPDSNRDDMLDLHGPEREGGARATGSRESIDAIHVLSGRVIQENGDGVPAATVSWTAWDPEFLAHVTAAVQIPPTSIEKNSVDVETNGRGEFSIPRAPVGVDAQPSYLWITKPGFEASVVEFEANTDFDSRIFEIQLTAAHHITVEVTLDGLPIEGADVVQRAAFSRGSQAQYEGGVFAPKERLLFIRRYRTREDGRVEISALPTAQRVEASSGEFVAVPWEGSNPLQIDLELRPTISVLGVVELPPAIDETWGRGQIRFSRARGAIMERIDEVELRDDGSFGPKVVPLPGAGDVLVRLEGNAFLPTSYVIKSPRAGDEVFVELVADLGHVKWFQAVSEAKEPIPGAEAVIRWVSKEGPQQRRVPGREDGYIMVLGAPTGAITGIVRADGYAANEFGAVILPEDPLEVLELVLKPGHTLSGFCSRSGQPATDFQLHYWPLDDTRERGTETILGSPDGRFELSGLPSGRMAIMAVDTEFGRSETITLDLDRDPRQEVELVIAAPGSALGRVISGPNQQPVGGALVQVYTGHYYTEMDALGGGVLTDEDGRFRVDRLASGMNHLSIHARGYSNRKLNVYTRDSGENNLGNVELLPTQRLTAQLKLPAGQDPTEWALSADGIGGIPATQFDSSGGVHIETASPGTFYFRVVDIHGAGHELAAQRIALEPGSPWNLEFDVAGGRSLVLQAKGAGSVSEGLLAARVTFSGLNGRRTTRRLSLDSRGKGSIPAGIGAGMVMVHIWQGQKPGVRSGSTLHLVGDGDSQEILIEVPLRESSTQVRVVDVKGVPLPGILVNLRSSQYADRQLAWGYTDSAGILILGNLPPEVDRVDLTSNTGGVHYGIEVELPHEDDEVLEVVFESGASLGIRVVDEGVPQSSVNCHLWEREVGILMTSGQTPDAEGRLTFEDLCPGTYELRIEGQAHWPVRQDVEVKTGGSALTLEARRTASLELKFVRVDGSSFARQQVELECTDMGERARNWIAAGLLTGFEDGLITDEHGVLSMPRVPHGEYRWTTDTASGVLSLDAGEQLSRRVVLP